MSLKIGDAVFLRSGQPGVVRGRSEATGQLTVEPELKAVQTEFRHGYLNGLEPAARAELNEILDGVKNDAAEPRERVEALRARIDEVEQDPTRHQLARYLRAEMAHIMNTHGIKPREYSIHETKAR